MRFCCGEFYSFSRCCIYSRISSIDKPHLILLQKRFNTSGDLSTTGDSRGSLVYRSPHRKLVLGAKAFSLSSSSIVILSQPILFSCIYDSKAFFVTLFGSLLFSLSTPLLLHFLTRSHVTELYYNRDSKIFTAYLKGIFLNTKKLEFAAEHVKFEELALAMTTITAKGVPLFLSEADFTDSEVYKHLVGFDQPLDLKKF